MVVVALAIPDAFGDPSVISGVAYFVVRLLHALLYERIAPPGTRAALRGVVPGILDRCCSSLLDPSTARSRAHSGSYLRDQTHPSAYRGGSARKVNATRPYCKPLRAPIGSTIVWEQRSACAHVRL